MVSEKIKNILAIENGEEFKEKRYIDLVREGGKKEYDLEDEVAILRKIVYKLLEYIETVHPEVVGSEVHKEFTAYNEYYEAVKLQARGLLSEQGGTTQ